jgi:hypothetical protein
MRNLIARTDDRTPQGLAAGSFLPARSTVLGDAWKERLADRGVTLIDEIA